MRVVDKNKVVFIVKKGILVLVKSLEEEHKGFILTPMKYVIKGIQCNCVRWESKALQN